MVRDPGQQGRLHGASRARRPRRRAQPGDVRQGCRRGARGRLPAVRRVVAARRQVDSRRHHDPRHSVRQIVRRELRGRPQSHAAAQHRVRRRAGGATRVRHGRGERDAAREVRQETRAPRRQLPCDPARLRLREGQLRLSAAISPRANGRRQDERQHPDRRQRGRRARCGVRRRDGRRVVPDHALDVADGSVQGILRTFPSRPDDGRAQVRADSSRRRARGRRHGDRRGMGGRTRVHIDGRPGHLADERVHRTCVLHRNPRRLLRHSAHRPVDRHADAHAARRPALDRVSVAWRHEAHRALSGESGRVLHAPSKHSISPSVSRRRCS